MRNAQLVELETLAASALAYINPWVLVATVALWFATKLPELATKAGDWYETGNVQLPDNEKLQAAIEQISHGLCRISSNIAITAGDNRSVSELVYPPGVEAILGNPVTWVAADSKFETVAKSFIKVLTNREVVGPLVDNWSALPNWLDTLQVEGIVGRFDTFLERFGASLFYVDPVDQIERGLAEIVATTPTGGGGGVDLEALVEALDKYFLITRDGYTWSISELIFALINNGMFIYK